MQKKQSWSFRECSINRIELLIINIFLNFKILSLCNNSFKLMASKSITIATAYMTHSKLGEKSFKKRVKNYLWPSLPVLKA